MEEKPNFVESEDFRKHKVAATFIELFFLFMVCSGLVFFRILALSSPTLNLSWIWSLWLLPFIVFVPWAVIFMLYSKFLPLWITSLAFVFSLMLSAIPQLVFYWGKSESVAYWITLSASLLFILSIILSFSSNDNVSTIGLSGVTIIPFLLGMLFLFCTLLPLLPNLGVSPWCGMGPFGSNSFDWIDFLLGLSFIFGFVYEFLLDNRGFNYSDIWPTNFFQRSRYRVTTWGLAGHQRDAAYAHSLKAMVQLQKVKNDTEALLQKADAFSEALGDMTASLTTIKQSTATISVQNQSIEERLEEQASVDEKEWATVKSAIDQAMKMPDFDQEEERIKAEFSDCPKNQERGDIWNALTSASLIMKAWSRQDNPKQDYSGVVILLSKALEIALVDDYYDAFDAYLNGHAEQKAKIGSAHACFSACYKLVGLHKDYAENSSLKQAYLDKMLSKKDSYRFKPVSKKELFSKNDWPKVTLGSFDSLFFVMGCDGQEFWDGESQETVKTIQSVFSDFLKHGFLWNPSDSTNFNQEYATYALKTYLLADKYFENTYRNKAAHRGVIAKEQASEYFELIVNSEHYLHDLLCLDPARRSILHKAQSQNN